MNGSALNVREGMNDIFRKQLGQVRKLYSHCRGIRIVRMKITVKNGWNGELV